MNDKVHIPFDALRGLTLREPIVVTVIALIVLQSVVEATLQDGFTWQTLVLSGITAVMGIFMRQSVYSPATYERDVDIARRTPVVYSNDIPTDDPA